MLGSSDQALKVEVDVIPEGDGAACFVPAFERQEPRGQAS